MKSVLGTELKFNVHLDPIDGVHMQDYEFECSFYTYRGKKVVIPKEKMKRVDNDNYIAVIDSENATRINRSQIEVEITAHIPDTDFPDGLRTEKLVLCTNVTIV